MSQFCCDKYPGKVISHISSCMVSECVELSNREKPLEYTFCVHVQRSLFQHSSVAVTECMPPQNKLHTKKQLKLNWFNPAYIFTCTNTHTYMHIMHTYRHRVCWLCGCFDPAYIFTCVHAHTYEQTHTHKYIHTYIHTHSHAYV